MHHKYLEPLVRQESAVEARGACRAERCGRLSGADVLRTMPSKAIELASFDLYKKLFASLRPRGTDGKHHPSGLGVTLAGALAGEIPPLFFAVLSLEAY